MKEEPSEKNIEQIPGDGDFDLSPSVADAVSELLDDVDLTDQTQEVRAVAEELVEKFTSPLMLQRAAGATSQVSVVSILKVESKVVVQ